MQALRRILGIEWYDKVSNVATGLQEIRSYLIYRFSLLTDVIRYLVTFVVYLRTHLPCRHCNCQLMPTLALLQLQTGNDHQVVQGEHGCNKSKRTVGYLSVLLRSQAKIASINQSIKHDNF